MTLFITRLGGNGQAQLSPTLSSAAVQPPRTQAQPEVVVKPFPPLEPTAITLNIPGLSIEIPRLSDREEIAIGRQAVQEFERQILISSDPSLSGRVDAVGRKISAHTPRSNLPYTFKVIETDEINAYALPGGYIYVARGLLEFVRSQDELAGVIGHEIAHVGLRHGARLVEGLAAAEIALEAIATQNPDLSHIYSQNEVQLAAQAVAEIAVNGWSRHAELDADEYGAVYMHLVGYDVQGYLDLLERIRALEAVTGKAGSIERLLATHPPFDERIFRVGEAVKKPGLKR